MGRCSWKENYGSNDYAIAGLVWSAESLDLSDISLVQLKHGLVGFTMGSFWRSGANWTVSVLLCATVRALGSVVYVLITSFLIRENLFALITMNLHAALTFIFTAAGIYTVPSMEAIYAIFSILVYINNGCFTFLLHILYAAFLSRLGMKASLTLPRWLEKAI
ncbi:uncharacterized protein LOC126791228 isoform X2 [Argentina anserina]|uniref:uncharacterized protein LOC126791228 isoform X2 n=1 Tax=Argentina anserina TaxID=57926 RepID=UPI0021766B92|nr:uncharacterized protein LOC126791228 isoform X2 [Potentilla anserina]